MNHAFCKRSLNDLNARNHNWARSILPYRRQFGDDPVWLRERFVEQDMSNKRCYHFMEALGSPLKHAFEYTNDRAVQLNQDNIWTVLHYLLNGRIIPMGEPSLMLQHIMMIMYVWGGGNCSSTLNHCTKFFQWFVLCINLCNEFRYQLTPTPHTQRITK